MKRIVNQRPTRLGALALGLLPFLLVFFAYVTASAARLAANPDDKLLPSLSTFTESVQRLAGTPDARSGRVPWWADTASSLARLGAAVGVGAALGLVLGVSLGAVPLLGATFTPALAATSLVPPMALLPILFIAFGMGELSKVVLIVVGITPVIARDLQGRVREIPRELLVKAQTLGASSWQLVVRVILPMALPRLVESVRLSLGAAWLFLIAAEAIAATDGLGYRIFLVRRYLAMDVILPYVAWITLLAYGMDRALVWVARRAFRWQGGAA